MSQDCRTHNQTKFAAALALAAGLLFSVSSADARQQNAAPATSQAYQPRPLLRRRLRRPRRPLRNPPCRRKPPRRHRCFT